MNYPLISEYIEAIKAAEDNFEELSYLRPVLGDDGLPVMTSGNFAVVFKMKDEQSGKFYAVKCFTKEQDGREEAYREIAKELKDVSSPYLVSIRYLEKELFVDTDQTTETEFPVLLMDWVEGKTLDKYLRENLDDKYALEMLAYRFSQLAQWLIPQPFAHGDLKPENILVREDGTLVLVDYDGMYVPAMKGQKARELGSPDFRHPLRTENDFDEHIDNFPFISILLSLKAISLFPLLLKEFGNSNCLLLSLTDYQDISNSRLIKQLFPSGNMELNNIIASFVLCLGSFKNNPLTFVNIECPEQYYSTSVTEDDVRSALEFDYVLYSKDRRKLLRRKDEIEASRDVCHIMEGTEIICDYAFKSKEYGPPYTIWLPQSIIKVGKDVFSTSYSPGISEIVVPVGCEQKYSHLMPQYKHLISCFTTKVNNEEIKEGESDKYGVVYSKDGLRLLSCPNSADIETVEIQEGTKVICDGALAGQLTHDGYKSCFVDSALKKVLLPESVEIIGENVFSHCISLENIVLPNSLKKIYGGAFWRSSLVELIIPKSVEFIGDLAFMDCANLKKIRFEGNTIIQSSDVFFQTYPDIIEIPKGSRTHYEHYLPNLIDKFVEIDSELDSLETTVTEKDEVNGWSDEQGAVYSSDGKRLLAYGSYAKTDIYIIKEGTIVICDLAFNNYENDNHFLSRILIPPSVLIIGMNPFAGCIGLSILCNSPFFKVEDDILYTQNYSHLISSTNSICETLKLHHEVQTIGAYALSYCQAKSIVLSACLRTIEEYAFSYSDIEYLMIPSGVEKIEKRAFEGCKFLTDVFLEGDYTDIDISSFEGCTNLRHIIVYNARVDFYKAKLPNFANIILGIGDDSACYYGLTGSEIAMEIFKLGKACWEGKDDKKDLNEAISLYEFAYKLGNEEAGKELQLAAAEVADKKIMDGYQGMIRIKK